MPRNRAEIGAEKRQRTKLTIVRSAFHLFDHIDVGRITIDDVIKSAAISRGSFYNYFLTLEDMIKYLAAEISGQINKEQSIYFENTVDMAEKICLNSRYFLYRAISDLACSNILLRAMPLVGALNDQMQDHARLGFQEAMRRGAIAVPSADLALEVGYGIAISVIRRRINNSYVEGDIEDAGFLLMRMFGVDEAKAKTISTIPIKMPETPLRDSLFIESLPQS